MQARFFFVFFVLLTTGCTNYAPKPGSSSYFPAKVDRGQDAVSSEEASVISPKDKTARQQQGESSLKANPNDSDIPGTMYKDIWQRIRAGLRFPEHDRRESRVTKMVSWFSGRTGTLNRASERATPYLYHIVEEAERRGLPMEIALLPFVESGFRPTVRSHAGAMGIWQFIPSSGVRYGLKIDRWYDGRRDVMAATRAAFDYLEYLHELFSGDWYLALAAYNAGEKRVMSAIARNKKAHKPSDYWSLSSLPRETRRYVPSLIAVSEIISAPTRYALDLPEIANKPFFKVVELDRPVSLEAASEFTALSFKEFRELNAGYKYEFTHPDGPYRLLVLSGEAKAFKEAVETLPEMPYPLLQEHRIRGGETLSGIANRYGVTVREIKETNQIRRDLIRKGGKLLIPWRRQRTAKVSPAAKRHDRLKATSNKAKAFVARKRGDESFFYYTVVSGDSLSKIAKQFGVTVADLTAMNGFSANAILRLEQKIVVSPNGNTKTPRRTISYRVKRGDSLWRIANDHGTSTDEIRRWNNIRSNTIWPGQRISIYIDS